MLLILLFLAGCAIGAVRAARRGGKMVDIVRYGFIHGLALALVAFIIAVLGDWWGWF